MIQAFQKQDKCQFYFLDWQKHWYYTKENGKSMYLPFNAIGLKYLKIFMHDSTHNQWFQSMYKKDCDLTTMVQLFGGSLNL